MEVRLIDSYYEYSRSITRADGMRLDIVCFRKEHELVIAVVNDDDIHVQEVAFSPEELAVLREHLADPISQSILGGESEKDAPSS